MATATGAAAGMATATGASAAIANGGALAAIANGAALAAIASGGGEIAARRAQARSPYQALRGDAYLKWVAGTRRSATA